MACWEPLLADDKDEPEKGLHDSWVSADRLNLFEGADKFVMKGHSEFESFEISLDLLFDGFILNCDHFQHFLHVVDKVFEIVIFLDYFIDGKSHSGHPLPAKVVGQLILL